MKIVVDVNDQVAVSFLTKLGALVQESGVFLLPEGGSKEIYCWSSDKSEMGKKSFSLSEGKTAHQIPSWCGELANKIVLIINKDRLVRIETAHLLAMLRNVTKEWTAPKAVKSRAGGILFEKFLATGRVITKPIEIIGTNTLFNESLGISAPPLYYGTTDPANVFELLQVIKSANYLNLPGVYDTYSHAHSIGDYWNRVLGPSLALFSDTPFSTLALPFDAKPTHPVNPDDIFNFLKAAGLDLVIPTAVKLAENNSFANWYRSGMLYLANHVSKLMGFTVPIYVTPAELLLSGTFIGKLSLRQIASRLESQMNHSLVVANLPDGKQVKSDSLANLGQKNMDQLHELGGWLGGAPIYSACYSLGSFGPLVMLVKDSKAGLVHLLAEPYLKDPFGTYLLPVGLVRLSATGQSPDASIDPWVFLELLLRNKDPQKLLIEIFNAMPVPLSTDIVGQKTLMDINLNGLNIKQILDY